MDTEDIWNSIAKFYAGSYDSISRHLERYVELRNSFQHIEPGSLEELRAVAQLTLEIVASSFEESANHRFLRIEGEDGWTSPIVRYIVEYKDDICENPDEELDPIQGWVGDLSSEGMLPHAADEPLPSYEIINWTIKQRNRGK